MKRFALAAAALLAAATLTVGAADAQGRARGARQNAAGGITAGQVHNNVGPNGGQRVGGRGVVTDGQGNAAAGAANCAAGAAGRACRAGAVTRSADGTVTRQGGAAVEGANGGSASTQGGFVRNPDGTYSGGRTTEAAGANGTHSAQTDYNSETGVTRTVTCTDAGGAVVACPTR